MVTYADTSFLVSLYGQDANSPVAQRVASALTPPLAFPPLVRHEARNAFRLAVFRREITAVQCQAVLAAIEADLTAGVLADAPLVWGDVYAEADTLSAAHTAGLGTRAADVLQVAAALVLGVQRFLTFDARQRALAAKAGLEVLPEDPAG
jgi:predicted nucleic acid-binding protein